MAEVGVGLSLFVEHGRQQEAADFYTAAFGARQVEAHSCDCEPVAVDMLFGAMAISVAGANPSREADPTLGGPFFPKAPGAVSVVLRLTIDDLDAVVARAVRAGATLRDGVGVDDTGSRSASLVDPFGHIWGLTEPRAGASRLAA